jgi:hypothetical protein
MVTNVIINKTTNTFTLAIVQNCFNFKDNADVDFLSDLHFYHDVNLAQTDIITTPFVLHISYLLYIAVIM